jgi:hypothetical protein
MQSSRLSPVQTALIKAQSMIGGTIHTRKRKVRIVSTVSRVEAKRFTLSQPAYPGTGDRRRHFRAFLRADIGD